MSGDEDLFREALLRDPYPFYAEWRRASPIFFSERIGGWLVCRYADAASLLRDPRFRPCRPAFPSQRPDGFQALRDVIDRWAVFEHPPNHTRLRRLLNHALTMNFIATRGPSITSMVGDVLDECHSRRHFDLIHDMAVPAAVVALADAMNLPREDGPHLRRWAAAIIPLVDGSLRNASLPITVAAVREAVAYLTPIVQHRMAHPGSDLISRLTDPSAAADASEADIVATCVLLIMAGHETTSALVGNAFAALFTHLQERERLKRDPSLGPLAVEEFLRFDSPVQLTSRLPNEDVEWSGATFRKDAVVNVLLGSANRDPEEFPDAERLDVGRTKNPHLAFSGGMHRCAGATLARLTARVTIDEVVRRFPDMRPGLEEPIRRRGEVVRGFDSFPVQI